MNIDLNTKVIARLHTTENGTGLNIYNPYFEAQGINAVYLLFKNPDPKPLFDGIRNLAISGAIAAGFEHHPDASSLADELSEAAQLSERVGILINQNGKIRAHYQGGEGLLSAIQSKVDISQKKIVIIGAGTVAKTLLLAIEQQDQQPASVTVVNRTREHAEKLQERFPLVQLLLSLEELDQAVGDILVNVTPIGSSIEDLYFTHDVVAKFSAVSDVTFGTEVTNLTTLAKDNQATVITGWDMFTHQAAVVLKQILDHDADIAVLKTFVAAGLSG